MTTPTFPTAALDDLADIIDDWYSCTAEATTLLAQEAIRVNSVDVAGPFAWDRYVASPNRTDGHDPLEPIEVIPAAAQFLTVLTAGEVHATFGRATHTQTIEDYTYGQDVPALLAIVPTGDDITSAHLFLAAIDHLTAKRAL